MNLLKRINFASTSQFSLVLAAGVFFSGMASATSQTSDKEEFVEPKDVEVVEVKGKVNKNSGFFLRKIQRTVDDGGAVPNPQPTTPALSPIIQHIRLSMHPKQQRLRRPPRLGLIA